MAKTIQLKKPTKQLGQSKESLVDLDTKDPDSMEFLPIPQKAYSKDYST